MFVLFNHPINREIYIVWSRDLDLCDDVPGNVVVFVSPVSVCWCAVPGVLCLSCDVQRSVRNCAGKLFRRRGGVMMMVVMMMTIVMIVMMMMMPLTTMMAMTTTRTMITMVQDDDADAI